MHYYATIKMNLAKCFYFPNQTHIFNVNRLMVNVGIFLLAVSHLTFLFCEADSITESVSAAYMTVTSFGIFVSSMHTTLKTETIFKFIDNFTDRITKRSEYRLFLSNCILQI